MLYIHAYIGTKETENWESLEVIQLVPNKVLFPDHQFLSDDGFGINNYPLKLPEGEILNLGVAFTADNKGLNFVVEDHAGTLVNLFVFKHQLDTYDPSIVVRTAAGQYLSFMFSTQINDNS